jgi:putative nucleotidyltransferase with HDIG domain
MLKKRILSVIEDTPSRRNLVERLGQKGYDVRTAFSPQTAKDKIKDGMFGLVIVDFSAPMLDSLSFLTYYKDKNPVGKIVALSKKPDFSCALQAMRLYVSDYLIDPVSLDMLSISVDRAFYDSDKAIARMRAYAAEENLRLKDEIEKSNLDTITALANALEARDEYTRGHSARVAELSVRIGERMHLPDEEIKRLHYGGILHDIGKIGVDRGVLNKTTQLTRDEYSSIYEHTEIGVKIISSVESLNNILPLIKYHHEPYQHLATLIDHKGRDYLLVCIVKVADAFDAMVSDRPYRKALPADMAVTELMNYSGTEFHPRVVEEVALIIRGEKVQKLKSSDVGVFLGQSPIAPGYM